jgi:hypothetical protein
MLSLSQSSSHRGVAGDGGWALIVVAVAIIGRNPLRIGESPATIPDTAASVSV